MSLSSDDIFEAWRKLRDDNSFRPVTYILPRRTVAPFMRAAGVPEEEIEEFMTALGDDR